MIRVPFIAGRTLVSGLLHTLLFYTVPVLIVLVLIFYFLMRSGRRETPIELLKERYAKGEIDSGTFSRMSKEIAG